MLNQRSIHCIGFFCASMRFSVRFQQIKHFFYHFENQVFALWPLWIYISGCSTFGTMACWMVCAFVTTTIHFFFSSSSSQYQNEKQYLSHAIRIKCYMCCILFPFVTFEFRNIKHCQDFVSGSLSFWVWCKCHFNSQICMCKVFWIRRWKLHNALWFLVFCLKFQRDILAYPSFLPNSKAFMR